MDRYYTAMRRDVDGLTGRPFDVAVVGGGIVGLGIARDAALRGLRVALLERSDFAAETSSRTSKLAHGGLRYLEHGRLGLVRESVRERERLLRLAPHLVRPLPFLLPWEPGAGWPPLWALRAGLWIYDRFAEGRGGHRMLSTGDLIHREPLLAGRGWQGGALYHDAQMDDTRLALETALDAATAGAVLANHAEVTGFLREGGDIAGVVARDLVGNRELELRAALVVNATGPWGDGLLRLAGGGERTRLRPSKGAHLVYGEPLVRHGIIARSPADRRVFFILPWHGLTLIGTTDTDYAGPPGEVAPDDADRDYLLAAAGRILPAARLDPARIISAFAGVRPLLAADADHPSAASREHAVFEEPRGLLSVLGGKYTTFRSMAEQATDVILSRLGRPAATCPTRDRPFPGAGEPRLPSPPPPSPVWPRLAGFYGARAAGVAAVAASMPDGWESLCPHTWHVKAEVAFTIREEMACTVEDVLARRLGLVHTTTCQGACAEAFVHAALLPPG